MILPLVISALAVGITLFYASILDLKDRRVPFRTWYPMIAIAVPGTLFSYVGSALSDPWKTGLLIMMIGFFCLIFYAFAAFGLFGGADAWALIFIAALVPLFPIEPYLGYPPLGLLPFTVLTNAVLINIAAPAGLFIWNILQGHRAPVPYLFFGYPVPGNRIEHAFGFLMEEIEEKDNNISRRFIPIRELILRMFRGQRTLYTKELRNNPDKYGKELSLFRRAGYVWILYGVPFILPITAGFITAVFLGDILYYMIKIAAGA